MQPPILLALVCERVARFPGGRATALKGHTDPVNNVVFTPDGKTLISQSYKDIKLWDTASGKCMKTLGR